MSAEKFISAITFEHRAFVDNLKQEQYCIIYDIK